jgi:hypothetical protein
VHWHVNYPENLILPTTAALSRALKKFPVRAHTFEFCKDIISTLTPNYVEAARNGSLRPALAQLKIGDLVDSILDANCDAAWERRGLRQKLDACEEWLGLTTELLAVDPAPVAGHPPVEEQGQPAEKPEVLVPAEKAATPPVRDGGVRRPTPRRTRRKKRSLIWPKIFRLTSASTKENSHHPTPTTVSTVLEPPIKKPEAPKPNSTELASSRRERVDAYIRKVSGITGHKITRKDFWTVAGYKDRGPFERWQRNDKNASQAGNENLEHVFKKTPEEFVDTLNKKRPPK